MSYKTARHADLEGQVVLQGVSSSDIIRQARATDNHPTAVLCSIFGLHDKLREGRQCHSCMLLAKVSTPVRNRFRYNQQYAPLLLRVAGAQVHTIQCGAQFWSNILKMPVGSAFYYHAGGYVQSSKVGLEGNVARCHVDPSSHALKCPSTSIVSVKCRECGNIVMAQVMA